MKKLPSHASQYQHSFVSTTAQSLRSGNLQRLVKNAMKEHEVLITTNRAAVKALILSTASTGASVRTGTGRGMNGVLGRWWWSFAWTDEQSEACQTHQKPKKMPDLTRAGMPSGGGHCVHVSIAMQPNLHKAL